MGRDNHPKQRNRVRGRTLWEAGRRSWRERKREERQSKREITQAEKEKITLASFSCPSVSHKSFALTERDQMLAE